MDENIALPSSLVIGKTQASFSRPKGNAIISCFTDHTDCSTLIQQPVNKKK